MNKIRYYFTLDDLFDTNNITNYTEFKNYIVGAAEYTSVTFNTYFEAVYNLLVNRHLTDYVTYKDYCFEETYDGSFDPSPVSADFDNFARQFYGVYLESYDKYVAIFGFYSTQKANLLNQINSTSQTKFNDTPQNGGDWSSDDHLSTISTTTNETDVMPLINRLADIDKLYKNTIKDWADEFKYLFIPEGEYDVEVEE